MERFKQDQQEYAENIATVEKRLLPAVLADSQRNVDLSASWLIKNCSEGGVIDASARNILLAITTLDKAGLIDWKVPPKVAPVKNKRDFLQTNDGARQNQPNGKDVELAIQMSQERERRARLGDAENAETMSEAVALVSNHSSVSHSRTYRERAALRSEYDRLVAAKTHPKDLLKALKIKQDTFANSDVTRPRLSK